MEIQQPNEVFDQLLQDPIVKEWFSLEELKAATIEMIEVVHEVLGSQKIKGIGFHPDSENFFDLRGKTIHFGLGVLPQMIHTWFDILTGEGAAYIPPEMIKDYVRTSLRRIAAHEAGHCVIDCLPVEEMGLSQEEWGQLGISSLANSLMDCRDDGRLIALYSEHGTKVGKDVKTGLEFKFGPHGPLDWPSNLEAKMLHQGYPLRFTQFDCEAIRWWAYGVNHPFIDAKVKAVLEKFGPDIDFVARHPHCVPKHDPSGIEVKTKGKVAYRRVAQVYKGEYQQLIELDRDNQTVHQSISIVGLFENGESLPDELTQLLEERLAELEEPLAAELQAKLEQQREEKIQYEKAVHPVESMQQEISKGTNDLLLSSEENPPEPKKPKEDMLSLLGPAVRVEELSEPLREFLKKLFEEMQSVVEQLMQEMLGALLKQLIENPEKFLKSEEDKLNQLLRSPMRPSTHPTHEEMGKINNEPPKPGPPAPLLITPKASLLSSENLVHLMPKELRDAQEWLDAHVDMDEKIRAWKEAIYASRRGGEQLTGSITSKIHIPSLVREDIRRHLGAAPGDSERIFLKPDREREKITLSLLWRTQAISAEDALKLFLFLFKIYEDPEIYRYLDLEILISQKIPGLSKEEESRIPLVIAFGDDPVVNHDKLVSNLLAIQKVGQTGAGVQIVEDATALRTQRERLLAQNPRSKRRFALDCWDEAAIQSGVSDPLKAVRNEIEKTQEVLQGHAFCFVLNPHGSQLNHGEWYGKEHHLDWSSTEQLIRSLDVVCRTMIQYPDNYASRIDSSIEELEGDS